MTQDEQYLKILSVFHFVVAGAAYFFSLFPLIHLAVGIAAVSGAMGDADEFPAFTGWFFILISVTMIVSGMAFATALVLAGRALGRRRYYTFCLVMAGISCIFVPFGTVLGVFTIITLTKDSVRQLFDRPPTGRPEAV